jgi:hypothetical protein
MAQAGEHLPSIFVDLNSNPSTGKKKLNKRSPIIVWVAGFW